MATAIPNLLQSPLAPVQVSGISGDDWHRFKQYATGTMWWGSGAATQDLSIYRAGIGALGVTGGVFASAGVYANFGVTGQANIGAAPDGNPGVNFGTLSDAYFSRTGVNAIKAAGALSGTLNIAARTGAATQVAIGSNTSQAAVSFGSASDAKIYRTGAAALASDSSLTIDGTLAVAGSLFNVDASGRLGIGTAVDTARMIRVLAGAHPGSATTLYGIDNAPTFPSSTTTLGVVNQAALATAAAAFTMAQGDVFLAASPSVGAGSTITNHHGVRVNNQGASGVTNAYGLRIDATSGAATLNIGARIDTATTAALWLGADAAGTSTSGGITFGSGRDVSIFRSGTSQLSLSGNVTVTGTLTMIDKDIVLSASTGTRLGSSTSQKLAFFGSTPIVKPGALTQTYATADATLNTPTAAAVSATGSTNAAPFGYTTAAQADAIVTAVNALRTDLLDLAQFVNSLTDSLQSLGLVG